MRRFHADLASGPALCVALDTQGPGFALTAVLTLVVGIGGVTAVFSVVEAVMLRPLPFKDPGRLISLHESFEHDSHELRMTAPDVLISGTESRIIRR